MPIHLTILSAIPFLLFTILFWRRVKLIRTSLITFILIAVIAVGYWKILPSYLLGSLEKGFFVAVDIFFIILGAVFFLETLKKVGVVKNLGIYLGSITSDIRIQVILLAWFLENFLEGIAGFGTPATVVAPLLIGLGVSPLNAVIISLLGNSAAGVFGAAGTPIKTGFGAIAGSNVAFNASLFNLVGILIPIFMVWFVTRGRENGKKLLLEMTPFALLSGISFSIPSIFMVFVGQEFPTILGSVVGLLIMLIVIKYKIFVPKKEFSFKTVNSNKTELSVWKVIFPYILLISLLIIGKVFLGMKGYHVPILIKHTFNYFNPGFALILSGIMVVLIYRVPFGSFLNSLKFSFKKSMEPFLVIVFMSSIAQIMVNSSNNTSGISSMVNSLSTLMKNRLLPVTSPLIGAFGSFVTGSVTVSNLMFGNFVRQAAIEINYNVDKILALTVVGGAFGNMIALADILVAEAVVGMKNREKDVIAGVIIPCVICLLLVGCLGLLFT